MSELFQADKKLMSIKIDKTLGLPELDAARLFLTQLSLAYIFASSDAKYTNTHPLQYLLYRACYQLKFKDTTSVQILLLSFAFEQLQDED